jgi:hypothetical protein
MVSRVAAPLLGFLVCVLEVDAAANAAARNWFSSVVCPGRLFAKLPPVNCPQVIFTVRIYVSDLVGDTGIEPVTSSV